MIHRDAEGMKTGRRLAVKAHGGFMKRMAGAALAGLERLDARGPKTSYGSRDSRVDLPITSLRLLIGHVKAYRPVSDLNRLRRYTGGGNDDLAVRPELPREAHPRNARERELAVRAGRGRAAARERPRERYEGCRETEDVQ